MKRLIMGLSLAVALSVISTEAKASFTLTYAIDSHSVPPNGTDLMQVFCPAGTVLTSGGWDTTAAQGKFLMVWVSRQVGNSWRIMTVNTHPTASLGINGYAVCGFGLAGLSSTAVSLGPVNVPAFSRGSGSVFCNNGGIPTGVGFDSNFPDPAKLIPIQATRDGSGFGTVVEYNSTNQAKAFTIYMTCTRIPNGSISVRSGFQTTIPGNSSATVSSLDCPAGDVAVGGGFVTSVGGVNPTVSTQRVRTYGNLPITSNPFRWMARAVNSNTADSAFLTPYAYCLHIN